MVAFGISVALGSYTSTPLIVVLVFLIAAFKAYLVITRFMHLSFEPHYLQLMVVSLVIVLLILFVGLVPDIVTVSVLKEGS